MYVAQLELADFRSYEHVAVPLTPGVTAFVGPNGQGKTNLVEAVGYVATLASHRVPNDAPLVRVGAKNAIVRADVRRAQDDAERSIVVEIEINPSGRNRARMNRSPLPRPRDALGVLRTVLFAPEDLALVKGDPDGRRRFLDELLTLLHPRMAAVRADYDKVVKQRSALLKSASRRGSPDLHTLDVWDDQLATLGGQLLASRLAVIRALRPYVHEAYEQVSSAQGDARIGYRSSANLDPAKESEFGDPDGLREELLAALIAVRSRELDRGVCLVGPHRDDVLLDLGGVPAKGYASHGESWSYALALKLASYRLLSEGGSDFWAGPAYGADGEPVLVLDDVFAELDSKRRKRLAQLVAPARQVLITAAVPEDVPAELDGVRLAVSDGRVGDD